jgi:site-specific recombinase XerD
MSALAPTLQAFFTDRLIRQRQASPHTIVAYRDTFRLLLGYVADSRGKPPATLDFDDLDAATIAGFLTHLEDDRRVGVATRNARLAAIHSLFAFAALRHPEHAALITRVLALPAKRRTRPLVTFLDRAEIDALLAAPDRARWPGRRDHALLTLAIQTGLRASELTALRTADLSLTRGAHLRIRGKCRRRRNSPAVCSRNSPLGSGVMSTRSGLVWPGAWGGAVG